MGTGGIITELTNASSLSLDRLLNNDAAPEPLPVNENAAPPSENDNPLPEP